MINTCCVITVKVATYGFIFIYIYTYIHVNVYIHIYICILRGMTSSESYQVHPIKSGDGYQRMGL